MVRDKQVQRTVVAVMQNKGASWFRNGCGAVFFFGGGRLEAEFRFRFKDLE